MLKKNIIKRPATNRFQRKNTTCALPHCNRGTGSKNNCLCPTCFAEKWDAHLEDRANDKAARE
jgi:hypothetical protein